MKRPLTTTESLALIDLGKKYDLEPCAKAAALLREAFELGNDAPRERPEDFEESRRDCNHAGCSPDCNCDCHTDCVKGYCKRPQPTSP